MSRAAEMWLRCLGAAAHAFAEMVDHELAAAPATAASAAASAEEPVPAERRVGRSRPTTLPVYCPFCAQAGLETLAQPAPASGRSWYRCERGHSFDRHQSSVTP